MGNLTALKVKSLNQPGRYNDGDGLMLCVSESGSKSWIVRAQVNGRRRDIGLGSAKLVTLAEAREAALETRRKLLKGIDPVAARKEARAVMLTFREAAKQVHEENRAGWKNGKHQDQWLKTLENYAFPAFGDLSVDKIEGPVIRDVLAAIWLSKPETARRVRQRIGTVLDWACAKGLRSTEAPMRSLARGLPRQPKKTGHFAALAYLDVPDFLESVRARQTSSRLALEALILTAARSGEIRGATWSEFDLDAAVWRVPAARMKMGRDHHVPLSTQALDVLRRAKALKVSCSDLVFPGQNVKKPLSDMTLLKILRDADLSVTVHGFRSAFRDWVADQTDYPGEVAEAALAHIVANKVEAAYRRTDFFEKRRALMRDWGAFCANLKNATGAD